MTFRITGLDPTPFRHLYGLSDDALAARRVERHRVGALPGYPDRIELRDLDPGEIALLLNYMHQPSDTPYRASHAIFILEGAEQRFEAVGTVPEVIRRRPISLRAFDAAGAMTDADLVDGTTIETLIEKFFADERTDYLHAHFAKRGCYAARIDRA